MLQFSTASLDSLVVKQTGQTLARRVLSADVVSEAERQAGLPAGSLTGQIAAGWSRTATWVEVSAHASTEAGAIAAANAVAGAVVSLNESQIQAQLQQAHANSLRPAERGGPALAGGRGRPGSPGGAVAGQSPGCHHRPLRIGRGDRSGRAGLARRDHPADGFGGRPGRRPAVAVWSPSCSASGVCAFAVCLSGPCGRCSPATGSAARGKPPDWSGRCWSPVVKIIAVVCPAGAREAGLALADDLSAFAGAHGHLVRNLGLVDDRAMALATLGRDARRDVPGIMNADMMIAVVDADSEAAHLLEGQSDFVAVVVARRSRTTVAAVAAAMEAFDRAGSSPGSGQVNATSSQRRVAAWIAVLFGLLVVLQRLSVPRPDQCLDAGAGGDRLDGPGQVGRDPGDRPHPAVLVARVRRDQRAGHAGATATGRPGGRDQPDRVDADRGGLASVHHACGRPRRRPPTCACCGT